MTDRPGSRRRGLRLRWGWIACALVIAAGASAAVATPTGTDPVVAKWPAWPYPTSCSGALTFDPVAAFSGPARAERGSSPSERALRKSLARRLIPWAPRHHWRLVAEGHGIAEFVSGRLSLYREPQWFGFSRRSGTWKWGGSGGCIPTSVVDGRSAVTWDLSAERGPLEPSSTTVWVNLGPGECDGGASQNARAHPVFLEWEGKLLLTIWLTPMPPGGYTCQGLIEPPLRVELPGPLGERQLYDGGTYPPHWALGRDRP